MGTYVILVGVLSVALWATSGILNPDILFLILILTAYTLLLVRQFRWFKLGLQGFEGELEELEEEAEQAPPALSAEASVDGSTIQGLYERTTDPRVVLLQLSVAIENKLAGIAARNGLEKQSFNEVMNQLKRREVLTDRFVLDGLKFFREQRNALVHRAKAPEIDKAISVGRILLAKLEQILGNNQ